MKLTTATAFIAASLSAPSISTSGVAASILEHENNKGSTRTAAKKQGVECAFVDNVTVRKSVDVGVLSCRVGKVCVEDSTSTLGGRCEVLGSANDGAAALEPQRERELCEKCVGIRACNEVVDQSKIGCGSCIGFAACNGLASDASIGDNSCVGESACLDAGAVSVGDNSCRGPGACYAIYGDDVPSNACVGDYICWHQYTAVGVGTPSPTAAPVTSSPTAAPVTPSPTVAPTATPVTSSPSAAPITTSPTTAPVTTYPSVAPSVTSSPSMEPSSRPSIQPSSQPSLEPSGSLSAQPSSQPSSEPSTQPSSLPSSQPSLQPTSMPSESPMSMPSSEPSDVPSCTPSQSPTPQPSINLFYPDWSPGSFNQGCINDGKQEAYMDVDVATYMFSTLDACCSAYFAWNYDACMGNLENTCARALWYPDWKGANTGCKRDGNEPLYMTQNAITKRECCDEHYSSSLECMDGSVGNTERKYYPDWTGDDICKNDGEGLTYLTLNPSMWLHDTRLECCAEHYKWKMDECMGLEVDGTGIYYPDWTGDNEACLNDRNEPQYMVQNPSIWMFSTLDECCEKYYSYNLATCTGASASTGTTKFWIRWSDKKCVQDCVGPSPCGGIAESWDTKYNTKAECCEENMSYDRRECINAD